jgi:hypothetical protein
MIPTIPLHEQFLLVRHKALQRERVQQPLRAGLPGHPDRLAHRLAPEVRGCSIGSGSSFKRLEVNCELEHSKNVILLLVIHIAICYF